MKMRYYTKKQFERQRVVCEIDLDASHIYLRPLACSSPSERHLTAHTLV